MEVGEERQEKGPTVAGGACLREAGKDGASATAQAESLRHGTDQLAARPGVEILPQGCESVTGFGRRGEILRPFWPDGLRTTPFRGAAHPGRSNS
jgi:hypothetical protein